MNSFGPLADRYDEWCETLLGRMVDRLEKETIFDLARIRAGTCCLDVGCGTGNYTLELAVRGVRTVGADPSPEMLRVAKAKAECAGLDIHLVQAPAEGLPFSTGAFDLVIAVTTLEFVSDQRAAAEEMLRVVRPGGQLVVGVLTRWSLWALVRRVEGALAPSIYNSARFLSGREVRALLRSAGGDALRTRAAVFIPPVQWSMVLRAATVAEAIGRRAALPGAAFLAAGCRKPA